MATKDFSLVKISVTIELIKIYKKDEIEIDLPQKEGSTEINIGSKSNSILRKQIRRFIRRLHNWTRFSKRIMKADNKIIIIFYLINYIFSYISFIKMLNYKKIY